MKTKHYQKAGTDAKILVCLDCLISYFSSQTRALKIQHTLWLGPHHSATSLRELALDPGVPPAGRAPQSLVMQWWAGGVLLSLVGRLAVSPVMLTHWGMPCPSSCVALGPAQSLVCGAPGSPHLLDVVLPESSLPLLLVFASVSSQTNIRNAIFDQRSTRPQEVGVSRWHRQTHRNAMSCSTEGCQHFLNLHGFLWAS